NILNKNQVTGEYIKEKVMDLNEHKNIGEVRNLGMITAIEIVKDKKTKTPFDGKERIGAAIYRLAESKGVLLRNIGDIIYFMPPYIINDEEIDFMTEKAKEAILEILNN
nr:aminotransferase class III-fold pyridoxal phosphate-dependent enzyme [Spirochaetota bacterium]